MKCPKCDEGELIKIKFKVGGKEAHLCDFCNGLWFDNETLSVTTGHTLRTYTQDKQNVFEELNDEDQDHQAVKPVRYL